MSETIGLRLRTPKGDIVEARGAIGDTLLRAAQAAGLPLEGTCEGQMACSTCHVVVDPEWFDRLEAAILAKAFRGELVPQDPNDEPASVLLDRIRAERAAAPKAKRGRRPKAG